MRYHYVLFLVVSVLYGMYSLSDITSVFAGELSVPGVAASSMEYSFEPQKTIDNDLNTYWQGALFQNDYWVQLDLTMAYELRQIKIWWNRDYGAVSYDIEASLTGAEWVDLYSGLSSWPAQVNPVVQSYPLSGTYRYVRVHINKLQNTYPLIYEIKVFGGTGTTGPTGSISINNNAAVTNNRLVTLTLSAQDENGGNGVSLMQFSNDTITWTDPEVYAVSKEWRIAGGDGTKTIYVKFKDQDGNWSKAYSDTISFEE